MSAYALIARYKPPAYSGLASNRKEYQDTMDNDFSQFKRGSLVAVRRQFAAGIPLEGGTYWFFAAKVQRLHHNEHLTVVFDDLAGKQVMMRFDQQGYPIRPDGVAERHSYERYGGLLMPITPTIERVFRHQKVLSAIWKLTWGELLLLQDYELDYLYALLSEAKSRGVVSQVVAERQAQRDDVSHPESQNWILCLRGDGFDLVERFPYRRGDRVSVEAQSVERDDMPCAALLVRFTSDDGGFYAEQLAFLRVFLRRATTFDMSEPLNALRLSGSEKAREV